MRIVMSMPGRHGDILWALPSARALAETFDTPITLVLSPKYSSLADLLRLQPYLAEVAIDPAWEIVESAPMTPRVPPTPIEADLVIHAGYIGWPSLPLPFEVEQLVRRHVTKSLEPIDLKRPWITAPKPVLHTTRMTVGFTDEWFELKYGVVALVTQGARFYSVCGSPRWRTEGRQSSQPWASAAQDIAESLLFFGCCSALHVLAVGLGKRCVIMEPNQQRWNPIFWPLGLDGPEVTCVKGMDGLPTFDSRHCADVLKRVLSEVSV